MKIGKSFAAVLALISAGCVSPDSPPVQGASASASKASDVVKALFDAAPFYVDACRQSGKSDYAKIEGSDATLACIDGSIEELSVTALKNWEGDDDSLIVVAISGGGLGSLW